MGDGPLLCHVSRKDGGVGSPTRYPRSGVRWPQWIMVNQDGILPSAEAKGIVKQIVTSRFTIASPRLDAACLATRFPWHVVNTVAPHEELDYHITTLDLGIGGHDRVDHHLVAAKASLLSQESTLDSLHRDCGYTLWIQCRFAAEGGDLSISSSLSAAFGQLRVDLMFRLCEG